MSTITYIVKVASGKFTIDGAVAPKLTFRDGDTFVFDQADASNSGHILQFSATSNNSGSSEYTTGVTKTGTAGQAGAKTTIVTSSSTTDTLYYYSSGGGTHGEEFSNSGFNTTAENLLKPIVGSDASAEKWGPMINQSIDQIVPKSGGTFSGDVIMSGDLTVSGTTTTVDTTLTVSDAMVVNNAGTDVGIKVNSTSTGHIMQLQDNGTDVLVVKDGGNVGVGTAEPSNLMHMYNNTAGTSIELKIENATANYNTALQFKTTVADWDVGSNINAPAGSFEVYERTSGSAGSRFTIAPGGNVGIGTTDTQGAKLAIKSAAYGGSGPHASADEFTIEGSGDSGMTIFSGTSSVGRIRFGDSGDNAVGNIKYDHSSNSLGLGANGGDSHLVINTSGNVGIGVTPSASYSLDVKNSLSVQGAEGVSAALYLRADEGDDNGDTWRIISNQNVNDLTFSNNSSGSYADKMTITSAGNVGITGTLTIGADDTGHDVIFYGATSGKKMQWDESLDTLSLHSSILENSVSGSYRLHPDANTVGTCTYAFKDDNDTGMIRTGANAMGLVTGGTARLNIDSSGLVGIGVTPATYGLKIDGPGNSGLFTGGVVSCGSLDNRSDERLKENITPLGNSLNIVNQLNPVTYNFKREIFAGENFAGFIAQEVKSIFPVAVRGDENETEEYEVTPAIEEVRDKDGNVTTEKAEAVMGERPVYMGIKMMEMLALLTKAVQELSAKVTALENA